MIKDDDEDDLSEEEVQARLQALMEENESEKNNIEQACFTTCNYELPSGIIYHFYKCIVYSIVYTIQYIIVYSIL